MLYPRTFLLTLCLLLSFSASAQKISSADYIVAVVNSEPITNHEVRTRASQLADQAKQSGQSPSATDLRQLALDALINEKAMISYAKDSGIKVDDAALDAAEKDVAQQNQLTVEQARQKVNAKGIDTKTFRETLRSRLLMSKLREREFDHLANVSDADIDQALLSPPYTSRGKLLTELSLAQILIPVPEAASAAEATQIQALAQNAFERIRSGDDFESVALSVKSSVSANPMSLRDADRYPDLFVSTVQNIPVGAIAAPVRSAAGFHILKLVDRKQKILATVTATHARHILLRLSASFTEAQAIQQLTEYKRSIELKKADFASLAKEHSQDGSAAEGGDLGWAMPGQFVPEFDKAMNALQPGQISAPLVSRFGVHLIELLDRKETVIPEQEFREVVRNELKEKKVEEAYANWVRELRGKSFVEFREASQ